MPAEAVPAGQDCRAQDGGSWVSMGAQHASMQGPAKACGVQVQPMQPQLPAATLTLHCVDPSVLLYWPGAHGSHSSAAVTLE